MAVEFALLLPAVLSVLMCTFDAFRVVMAQRKVDQLADTMADLTSQYKQVRHADIGQQVTGYFNLAAAVIDPLPLSRYAVRISSVSFYEDKGVKSSVCWTQVFRQQNGAFGDLSRGSPVSPSLIPQAMWDPSTTWIVAEVDYKVTTATGFLFRHPWTVTAKAMKRPRVIGFVTRPGAFNSGLPNEGTRCDPRPTP